MDLVKLILKLCIITNSFLTFWQSTFCTGISSTANEVQILKMSSESYEVRLPAQHAVDTAMFVINGTFFVAVANLYDPTTGTT